MEGPVYGWVGTVYAYARPAYDDYFVRNDGELFGIAGENAATERQLVAVRGQLVKVWGSLAEPAPDFNGRQIVVTEMISVGAAATATPQSGTGPEALITASVANVRSGPGTNYPRLTQVYGEELFDITGRNSASTWWQICCPGRRVSWVYGPLVEANGDLSDVPVVSVQPMPTPTPRPTPVSITEWRGEYYSNPDFSGSPVLIRNDKAIDFNWGDKSAVGALPADDFSVRWTRAPHFNQGDYRFYANADDGVKVWLDDHLVIDQWRSGPVSSSGDFLAVGEGTHSVRVEYFEHLGNAAVNVWWQQTDIFQHWRGEYYNDIYLQPPPALVRSDDAIDFNWGLGSPAPGMPHDNFSVRWLRNVYLSAGDYRFKLSGGDGARVSLDNWTIIDNWLKDSQHTFEGEFLSVGTGYHVLKVDWYARGGIASVKLSWDRFSRGGGPQPD